jgi:ABC-type dipeptide/oligopeptide/nickel transport system permease subunit
LVLIVIIVLSLLAPWIAPHDPLYAGYVALRPPSLQFIFGTDLLGRDVFSRVLHGGRWTLSVAALALILSVIPGLALGLLAGYAGGIVDQGIGVLLNALLAFPNLLVALSIIAILGNGPLQVAVAVGLAGIAPYARVARAAALSVRSRPFVEAARALGARPLRILLIYLLPNMAGTLTAFATVILSWAILSAATLNFLGFGGNPAIPEWGAMLAEGRQAIRVAPWAVIAPGVAITLTVLTVTLFADTLAKQE